MLIPFPVILEQAGYDGYSYNGKVYCPFHINENSPSAKLYQSDRGDTLFCFAEHKTYRPSDVIKYELINKSTYFIFSRVWKQLSEPRQIELLELYGKPLNIIPKVWTDSEVYLNKFKSGDITYNQHLNILVAILAKSTNGGGL